MSTKLRINVARWIERSLVNGPGERFVLWVQGCGLQCPGCWNPDTWSFAPRRLLTPDEVLARIDAVDGIEGVTLSGGEPFAQAPALLEVAHGVRARGLSLMIYTGHELDELRSRAARALLAEADVVVSGRFRIEARDTKLIWRGSRNQRVHFLSDRYSEADQVRVGELRAEIHIADDGTATVTGFPEARWLAELSG